MYKVCILAAGKGSRVSYSRIINKALLPAGDQAVISHIINKFPINIEIVIAVGYLADQVKDYVSLAHSDRTITFIEVDNWEGEGSGPGYSLLSCKSQLNCPFIFTSADTIVAEEIPEPTKNWVGVAPVHDSRDYCIAEVLNGLVRTFYDKVETDTLFKICLDYQTILNNALIGMVGVKDHGDFWDALVSSSDQLVRNELQVSNGFNRLIENKFFALPFTWFDTGSQASYEFTNRHFDKNRVLLKDNEFIYFERDLVIKYFYDRTVVERRVQRAELLHSLVPPLVSHKRNFYAYKKVRGKTLPKIINLPLFTDMLNEYREKLWVEKKLKQKEMAVFYKECEAFYKDKTEQRIMKFYEVSGLIG